MHLQTANAGSLAVGLYVPRTPVSSFAGALLGGRELFEAGFQMRREVCAEMLRRREDIEPFISGVFDAYVSSMALEGIWGGEDH